MCFFESVRCESRRMKFNQKIQKWRKKNIFLLIISTSIWNCNTKSIWSMNFQAFISFDMQNMHIEFPWINTKGYLAIFYVFCRSVSACVLVFAHIYTFSAYIDTENPIKLKWWHYVRRYEIRLQNCYELWVWGMDVWYNLQWQTY